MAVELGEGDHIALGRPWLPVVRRWRDPLWPPRQSAGAQEPLPLKLQQPALRHRDGRQSSAAMSLTGIFRWKKSDFTIARECARARWQGS